MCKRRTHLLKYPHEAITAEVDAVRTLLADTCPLSSGYKICHEYTLCQHNQGQCTKAQRSIRGLYTLQNTDTHTYTHTHTHTHQGHVSFKRADASIKKKERNREDAITSEHSWISVNVTHTQTRQVMLSCRVMKMAACSWNLIMYLAANWEKKNCGVTACFETWKGVEKVMLMSILWWNIRNLQSCTVYATDPYIHPLYTILTSPRGHVLISNDAGSGIKTKW